MQKCLKILIICMKLVLGINWSNVPSLNHFYVGRVKLSNISSQTDRKLQLHLVHRNLFNEKLRDWIPKWLKLITFPLSLMAILRWLMVFLYGNKTQTTSVHCAATYLLLVQYSCTCECENHSQHMANLFQVWFLSSKLDFWGWCGVYSALKLLKKKLPALFIEQIFDAQTALWLWFGR